MRDIIEAAQLIYALRYGEIEPHKGCLYWAAAFQEAAKDRGLEAFIQAGSAQFQFQEDDGKSITHFSYMFDVETAINRLERGLMAEIHVWNYLPVTDEIVDLTTRYQEQQALELAGLVWKKEFALPSYFWGKPKGTRLVYHPDPFALAIVQKVLANYRMKRQLEYIRRSAKVGRES